MCQEALFKEAIRRCKILFEIKTCTCFLKKDKCPSPDLFSEVMMMMMMIRNRFWWIDDHRRKELTLSWRRSLTCRNKSIDLLCKWMGWFLYDRGLRHERVKRYFQPRPLLAVLTIANLLQVASWIRIYAEPQLRIFRIKMRCSDKSYTTAPLYVTLGLTFLLILLFYC